MSLAREIFTLPEAKQDAAIRHVARQTIRLANSRKWDAAKLFNHDLIRPLTHAKHAAGAPRQELTALQKHYRFLFQQERAQMQLEAAAGMKVA